jgi:hypothetical protein
MGWLMVLETKPPLAVRVRAFVAKATGAPLHEIEPGTMLLYDLGMAADDAYYFLESFAKEFAVIPESFGEFDFVKQFGAEGVTFTMFLQLCPVILLCFLPPFGWMILSWYFKKQRQKLHEDGLNNPDAVTVQDLIDAAAARRWLKKQAV